MGLDDPKVQAVFEIIKPIFIQEYERWIDNPKKNNRGSIEHRLDGILDRKGILVNSLLTSPKFELCFCYPASGFDARSYFISLYNGGGGLQISQGVARDYGF